MSDPSVRFQGTQAGQPATPSTPEPVQPDKGSSAGKEQSQGNNAPAQPQPKFLTEAEAREIARREYQSLRDKEAARSQKVQKFTSDQIAAIKAAGIPITPEQERQIAQAAASHFPSEAEPSQAEPSPSPKGNSQAAEQPVTGAPLSEVENAALELVNEMGFDIAEGDPELSMIDTTSPRKYLKTYEQALEAKRARLGKAGGNSYTNPAGNIPTLVGRSLPGNAIQDITDPSTLIKMGLNKKR